MAYNLVGKVVNYIRVIRKSAERTIHGKTQWECACLCGNNFTTVTDRLTPNSKNQQQSCGRCEWQIKHKDAYISWMALTQRCLDTTHKDYSNYGGRGITMTSKWHKFQEFYIDMGDPPLDPITGERLSIDRKDNNGNYYKENCKWSTRREQQLNKR